MHPLAELIEVFSLLKDLDIRKSLTSGSGFLRPNPSPTGKTTHQSGDLDLSCQELVAEALGYRVPTNLCPWGGAEGI
jgi:hypothetical protein